MLVRLSAAICGATILFVCSSIAMARSEIRAVPAFAVDRAAHGSTVVGAASMYNPYRPGYREGGTSTATGERYNPSAAFIAPSSFVMTNDGALHYTLSLSFQQLDHG